MSNNNIAPVIFKRPRERHVVFSNSGTRFIDDYTAKYDDDGNIELVPDSKIDVYADIQSHADSVDLNVILAKFALTGDNSLLDKRRGIYGDFTDLPVDMVHALQAVDSARDFFDSLPLDVKEQFNMNSNEFIASIGSGKVADIISEFGAKPADQVEVKPEVKPLTPASAPISTGGDNVE